MFFMKSLQKGFKANHFLLYTGVIVEMRLREKERHILEIESSIRKHLAYTEKYILIYR